MYKGFGDEGSDRPLSLRIDRKARALRSTSRACLVLVLLGNLPVSCQSTRREVVLSLPRAADTRIFVSEVKSATELYLENNEEETFFELRVGLRESSMPPLLN